MLSRFCFVVFMFSLVACSTTKKIEALKPEPNYSNEVVYEKQVSYLNVPVVITVADIQNQVNKYLNGTIYEDNNLEDDNLMLKVWKQAPIELYENNGKIDIVLPLKIWAKVRYGFDKFGFKVYDTRELNFNGKIRLTSDIVFRNWKFITNTVITKLDWTEAPNINIAGTNVPITMLVNPAISLFKNQISKTIDESISKSLDIKPYVLSAMEQISKPIEVNKDYHIWFAAQPLELYTSQSIIANKKITIVMGMKAFVETSVASKPSLQFDKNKLLLLGAEKLPDDFGITVAGIVTYPSAAALMQANFNGKKFESGSRSVVINKIDIWGKDGKMIVALNMSGSVNGDFYLSGIPVYDSTRKEVYLDKVDFVLDSKNQLLRLGDWLAHGVIANKIKESCRYSVADQLVAAQNTLKTYFTNYHPIAGITINGNIGNLAPDKVFLTPNAIVTTIKANGKVAVSINGMQ